MIRAFLLLLVTSLAVIAADVPAWLVRGIAMRESSSFFDANGALVYVDRAIGAAGERGPWQMTLTAFREVEPTASFTILDDPVRAEPIARRRMAWLYARLGDWSLVAGAWHTGITGLHRYPAKAMEYIADVERKGNR